MAALEKLETACSGATPHQSNNGWTSRKSLHVLLAVLNRSTIAALIRAYAEELAETIGGKHGFKYGEEFNYHGPGEPTPEHVREKARSGRVDLSQQCDLP